MFTPRFAPGQRIRFAWGGGYEIDTIKEVMVYFGDINRQAIFYKLEGPCSQIFDFKQEWNIHAYC
jgi:hypothetical protein